MNKKEQKFVHTVWEYYEENGRGNLPWRKTDNPYKILVSEVMLQQTQVERVIPKYTRFIKKWGSARALTRASLSEVLKEWQGLGYNRRAKMLHACAKQLVGEYNNTFPKCTPMLQMLPGIGPYTAGAIMAFAYNKPVVMIETNIRTVFLHHFFKNKTNITDQQILQSIGATLDMNNPREWYWALMDYGAHLKKKHGNPNSQSKHYAKQSRFDGSDRQIRGAIIRELSKSKKNLFRFQIHSRLSQFENIRLDIQIEKLRNEGLIEANNNKYQLPN